MRFARGIELIEWTFDPLEIKNAYFNIERLGAIVRRFVPNQYGTTTSPLHGGLPTDRCVAEWWLGERARERATRRPRIDRAAVVARIAVPATSTPSARDDPQARARDPEGASASSSSDISSEGLAVIGFETTPERRNVSAREMGIKIERVTLRQIRMPLVHFFETSFGRTYERESCWWRSSSRRRVRLGRSHCGRESVSTTRSGPNPAWLILRDYVAPRVLGYELDSAADVAPLTAHIRGHHMARGGLEAAVWDLEARLATACLCGKQIGGGARREIPCGVSIGIQDSVRRNCLGRSRPKSPPAISASR